jgi:hypothetical protein
MQLYYFKDKEGNFGDDLNPWLWQQLFGDIFNNDDKDLFVGVGTLLNHRIPPAPAVTVFGSGHGYGQLPAIDANWRFYCVRGPLTAQTLGLSGDLAITDPASLAAQYFTAKTDKQFQISFMPHCESARLGDWAQVCARAGVNFIDPRQPFLNVFTQIKQTELLLTEAMHGAILADSFRVPWVPVKAYPHISTYKWQDWLQSVQLDASFSPLTPVWRGDNHCRPQLRLKNMLKRSLLHTPVWQTDWGKPPPKRSSEQEMTTSASMLAKLAQQAVPNLSSPAVFARNTSRLLDTVQQFKRDFGI